MTFPTPTTENVRYAPSLQALLTFYQAATTQTGGNACLVVIHGGSWVGNDRYTPTTAGGNGYDLCDYAMNSGLTAQTWTVISIDYRMGAYTGVNKSSYASYYPDPMDDTARAVQWIKDHATEYGINPNKVVLFGASAGGTNALHTAFRRSLPYFTTASPQFPRRFAYRSTSNVAAVINFLGVIDFRYDTAEASESWAYNHNTSGWTGLFGHSLTDGGAEWASEEMDLVKAAASPMQLLELPTLEASCAGVYSVYNATTETGKPFQNLHAQEQAAILHAQLDAKEIANDYEIITAGAWEDYAPTPATSPSYALSARVLGFIEPLLV